MFKFLAFSTPVNASDILGDPSTVQLCLKLQDKRLYDFQGQKTSITFTLLTWKGHDQVVYMDAKEEFCRVIGLWNSEHTFFKWPGEEKPSILVDCLRRWDSEVYDCTCLHPGFPHLISGWQAAIER